MSSEHQQVLTALAFHVAEHGTFPQRERFRAALSSRASAFDELVQWRELFPWNGGALIVWTIRALARIEADVDFARRELERGQVVYEELVRMYQEGLGRNRKVSEVASCVGFTNEHHVRRALMLLQPVPGIFEDFAVWLGDPEERFQISGGILTTNAEIFPRRGGASENGLTAQPGQLLGPRAGKLFLQLFAEPFRERGADPLRGPRTAKDRVVFEFLKTRGLLDKDGVTYRLSDFGREKALQPAQLAALLELEDGQTTSLGHNRPVGQPSAAPQTQHWDKAMHLLVDSQDDLGQIADALFRVLRQGRAHSRSPSTEQPPSLEIQVFETAVKAHVSEEAISQAIAICGTLPELDTLAQTLRQHLPQGRS